MAQTAKPLANATDIDAPSPQIQPRGNPRIGPGIGGTDKATVARLPIVPPTEGQSIDSRYRKGPR